MKQNAKRWLALFLAIAMVGSCGVFSNGSLHAEGESPYATTEQMEAEVPAEEQTAEAAPAAEQAVEETTPVESAETAEAAPAAEETEAAPAAEKTAEEAAPAETTETAAAESAAAEKAAEETAAVSAASEAAAASSVSEAAVASSSEELVASSSEEEKEEVREKTTYTYEDSNVNVVATLSDPTAVPDDAEFRVTPVTASTSGYNYDAYMTALNEKGQLASDEDFEYTEENTLLYDVAFIVDEKDADGNPTGNKVEYQPEAGTVNIQITFKQEQLTDGLQAEEATDVAVEHLPLTDAIKNSADTTAAATNISAADVNVESVNANVAAGESTQDAVSFATANM